VSNNDGLKLVTNNKRRTTVQKFLRLLPHISSQFYNLICKQEEISSACPCLTPITMVTKIRVFEHKIGDNLIL